MSETEIVTETAPAAPKKNKGGRPRKVQESAGGLSADQFQQLLAVLAANKSEPGAGIDIQALKTVLEGTAQMSAVSMRKAMKPENEVHPAKSVFSYPEGDVAKPRPTLPYEFYLNAYPVHKFPETQHWRELELMGQVEPGIYTVMRKDFTPMQVTVSGERDVNQKLTRISVEFPITREERGLVPPQVVLLYQLVYPDNPQRRFVEAMQEYLQMMSGGLAAVAN
jgi:hypothetical protein